MGTPGPHTRRALAAFVVVPSIAAALLLGGVAARADPATVSARPLATAQINGVAFAQVVVGDTVYVGGAFTTARRAGAAPGTGTHKRANLLAYDLTTGALKAWAPTTNGVVRALARSGDGKTIYATGAFTTVNGHKRARIVAIAASTGGVRSRFHPVLNGQGYGIAVSGATVYAGGSFTSASGRTRFRAAAFDRTSGAVRRWAPRLNGQVLAVVVSSTGRSAVVAGRFTSVNGHVERGSQRVSTGTGRTNLSWALNRVVQNSGRNAAVYSLTSAGDAVIGTGYSYGGTGKRLEGTFVAAWNGGAVRWIEDCHGDTYSAAQLADVVYIAGHPHDCRDVPGGFTQTSPVTYHRALAFTRAATGRLAHNTVSNYSDFGGRPAPTLLAWRPAFNTGTATGQVQGPWSVATGSGYVVYAGEFTKVAGVQQQGLVRFTR